MIAALPLFGHQPGPVLHDLARRDLGRHAERVLDWSTGHPGSRIYIEVARDPLGAWAACWGWGIGADLGQQTGHVGSGTPWTPARHTSRREAIAHAITDICQRLPSYTGAAGREVAKMRRALHQAHAEHFQEAEANA
jgi:hypothetical protein